MLVILPQSALEKLCKLKPVYQGATIKTNNCLMIKKKAQLNISYPMLFKLINGAEKKHSHAGVLEFTAEEGRVYLPQWVSY